MNNIDIGNLINNRDVTRNSSGDDYIVISNVKQKSPGLISVPFSCKAGNTYAVKVYGKTNASARAFVYLQGSPRVYLGTETGYAVATLFLTEDKEIQCGVLLEDAQGGHSFTLREISFGIYSPNFDSSVVDMDTSNADALKKSEIIVNNVKFRWNKENSRFQIGLVAESAESTSIIIYNDVNNRDFNSGTISDSLRVGFIGLTTDYTDFYPDFNDEYPNISAAYYRKFSYIFQFVATPNKYLIEAYMDGNNHLNLSMSYN